VGGKHGRRSIVRSFLVLVIGMVLAACSGTAATQTSTTEAVATTPVTVASGSAATTSNASALPELASTYVSPWYGYSVAYPEGWKTTDGEGPWPQGQVLRHGDRRLDEIEGSTAEGEGRFVAASQPVPAGTTLREFGGQENPFSCAPGDRLPKGLSIDGAPAFVTLDGCPSEAELGGLIWDVVVLSGGRAYDFTIDGALEASDAESWLASIRLDPAAARAG
jgi:hypothetical protein